MKLKSFTYLVIGCVLLIYFVGCDSFKKSGLEQLNTKQTLAQMDDLLMQLEKLDITECNNTDKVVTINEDIRGLVESIRNPTKFDSLVDILVQGNRQINFVASKDRQFGVFSWQTKMDCLGNQIKNIALYKSNGRVEASSLYGSPMLYGEISQTDHNREMHYTLRENTFKNTSDVAVKTYKISNGYIEETQIPLQELSYNKK
ncbi:MAG: hypothetical protein NXH90_03915 [Flavobacteriaceae bacterium]|nr:hypothetical protein [Flavobacteriaceae bacterium]